MFHRPTAERIGLVEPEAKSILRIGSVGNVPLLFTSLSINVRNGKSMHRVDSLPIAIRGTFIDISEQDGRMRLLHNSDTYDVCEAGAGWRPHFVALLAPMDVHEGTSMANMLLPVEVSSDYEDMQVNVTNRAINETYTSIVSPHVSGVLIGKFVDIQCLPPDSRETSF